MPSNTRRRPLDRDFVMPSLRLDGRVALVTGGSRGLGLGMALALAHSGADVALAARSEDQLAEAASLVRETGRNVVTVPTDVSEVAAVQAMVEETVKHFGRLDILVNAAGVNFRQPATEFTEANWDALMNVNLKGAFFAAQAAGAVMRGQGSGKIINLGSLSFEIVVPNIALYAISKGGLRQMTRALAVEWAAYNIQVNAIAPGRFWTAMTDAVFSDDALYESAVSVIPQGRPGVPSDLAGATVLLASEASNYITGQTIVVDGGWLVAGGVKG
ncbi:MAG: 2-deoxy-D-gluconate 3-dehydrogenase() [uncultured Truepera sp.]|uniref:2-deoxy-D-gluconate 3-dehydrogenase( ) n=1 Tax=uncultured Truepera sp. TaxID=543023 RepID=A0A6J4VG57_9DEIN|nr:MAG: 2-deoxy-D-gluconate 3-dehydrogenase() [uncultured Truepera sp.]